MKVHFVRKTNFISKGGIKGDEKLLSVEEDSFLD